MMIVTRNSFRNFILMGFFTGPHKPGSVRRMIGSPRQLENAVPTSKNPHGVWVWWTSSPIDVWTPGDVCGGSRARGRGLLPAKPGLRGRPNVLGNLPRLSLISRGCSSTMNKPMDIPLCGHHYRYAQTLLWWGRFWIRQQRPLSALQWTKLMSYPVVYDRRCCCIPAHLASLLMILSRLSMFYLGSYSCRS